MKVVYTDEALENLTGILNYIASHDPAIFPDSVAVRGFSNWRMAGKRAGSSRTARRSGRALDPLPHKVFYRHTDEAIEMIYIHHAARDEAPNE
jgi:plasmid stabilization system protein ParE